MKKIKLVNDKMSVRFNVGSGFKWLSARESEWIVDDTVFGFIEQQVNNMVGSGIVEVEDVAKESEEDSFVEEMTGEELGSKKRGRRTKYE